MFVNVEKKTRRYSFLVGLLKIVTKKKSVCAVQINKSNIFISILKIKKLVRKNKKMPRIFLRRAMYLLKEIYLFEDNFYFVFKTMVNDHLIENTK